MKNDPLHGVSDWFRDSSRLFEGSLERRYAHIRIDALFFVLSTLIRRSSIRSEKRTHLLPLLIGTSVDSAAGLINYPKNVVSDNPPAGSLRQLDDFYQLPSVFLRTPSRVFQKSTFLGGGGALLQTWRFPSAHRRSRADDGGERFRASRHELLFCALLSPPRYQRAAAGKKRPIDAKHAQDPFGNRPGLPINLGCGAGDRSPGAAAAPPLRQRNADTAAELASLMGTTNDMHIGQ